MLGHVTSAGNIFLPKRWRKELGIEANTSVIIEKKANRIIIEPLKKKSLKEAFKSIDAQMAKQGISFTREEALQDDLYD